MFTMIKTHLRARVPLICLCLVGLASEASAQATDVVCSKCVDTSDIAGEAITVWKLGAKAVTAAKIKNDAVTTPKIKGLSVTAPKIANGTIIAKKVNPKEIQLRINGTCAVGSFVAAIGEDGSVTCEDGGDANANTSYGESALSAVGDASGNTAIGYQALRDNVSGRWNTATGADALGKNTVGQYNSAYGVNALWRNLSGNSNTGIGLGALQQNSSGNNNTATGSGALSGNSTGDNNTAVGESALHDNAAGSANTALGYTALSSSADSDNNTAVGYAALWDHSSGASNVALGNFAGSGNTTGSFNVSIASPGVEGENNTTRIGTAGEQRRAFVAGIRGVTTGIADAVTVVIDSNGQLGTISSSARFKTDVNDMGDASGRLLALRPVTFQYKGAYDDGARPLEYGLIAEEVAEIFPELVVFGEEDRPETVKYRLLSSLLLNEVQKQHTTLSGQEAEIAELKTQLDILSRRLDQMSQDAG